MRRILFYGDSNTYGYDPVGYFGGRYDENTRWVDVLAKDVCAEWEVFSDGQNGRQIPRHTADYGFVARAINSHAPLSVFAVMLGSNDLFSMIPHETESNAERVAVRMEHFLTEVEKMPAVVSDNTKILLIAPPKMLFTEDFFFGGMPEEEDGVAELSRAYQRIAGAHGYFFADAAVWDLTLSHDGVHLAAKGHLTLAEKMAGVLRNLPDAP